MDRISKEVKDAFILQLVAQAGGREKSTATMETGVLWQDQVFKSDLGKIDLFCLSRFEWNFFFLQTLAVVINTSQSDYISLESSSFGQASLNA